MRLTNESVREDLQSDLESHDGKTVYICNSRHLSQPRVLRDRILFSSWRNRKDLCIMENDWDHLGYLDAWLHRWASVLGYKIYRWAKRISKNVEKRK